jgi:hypothetical protein
MQRLANALREFWCAPEDGEALAVTRALLGALLTYSLVVATFDLREFYSPEGWLPAELLAMSPRAPFNFTWLAWIDSLPGLYAAHAAAVFVAVLFTAGVALPVSGPAAALVALAYVARNDLVIYGFDQTLTPFLLYTALHRRRLCTGNRVARRLIQLHLCLIYAGAGFAKLHGSWFDGTGLWRVLATFETSRPALAGIVNLLGSQMWLLSIAGATVVLWECSYALLIWIRPLRPFVLATALAVHGGIGLFMRLAEFSLVMLAANAAFVPPQLWRSLGQRLAYALKGRLYLASKAGRMSLKPPLLPRPDEAKEDRYA